MTFPTLTASTLRPATAPTLYFIGVTTGSSSIQHVFPRWAAHLGLQDAVLQGIDLPLHAPADDYRAVVRFIAEDPLSLGALVTTHKIDLFAACRDLFDEIDAFAALMGETSCISKRDGRLICHAKDPISSGLALDAFLPAGFWSRGPADALCLGAGGSSIAISWYLSRQERGLDRPARVIVTNRSAARLEHLREIHATLPTDTLFEYHLTPTASDNARVLAGLAPRSLVVNATGLGKDAPGSPLPDDAVFPLDGVAWDLNYRGDLVFLDQARAQSAERRLRVEDGWIYFVHGWTQVIAEVFDIEIPTSGPSFERLSELALATR
ncbi:shikimate dehydrogenase [Microbacterium testaceum]|jgi:shikimate 5-dehydrogenase|uniref:shikimate dehydrogenase family protein n=1 Tax=Microbacterium testaceum TaxID=2033 RepID=UPI003414E188